MVLGRACPYAVVLGHGSFGPVPWSVHVRMPAWVASAPLVTVLMARRLSWLPGAMIDEAVIDVTFALLLYSGHAGPRR
jgi:hypothetical protein